VESIFGVPWDDLTPEAVEAFLADAGDEPLTWEAKGTLRPRPQSVRKHVCAFANANDGGFYIIGARREGKSGPWRLDGVDFEGIEPAQWLSNVIRNGLRPIPHYDVWSPPAEEAKRLAIVKVDAVAEPPCMTTGGDVFVRVSGESVPVEDPATLRRLFDRGEARIAATEAEALRAVDLDPANRQVVDGPFLSIGLAYAPTGRADDVAGRLFGRAYGETLLETTRRLPPSPVFDSHGANEASLWYQPTQSGLAVMHREGFQRWIVRASWDGAVAARLLAISPRPGTQEQLEAEVVFGAAVRPAAEGVQHLVASLGGYGRAHVALQVFGRQFDLNHLHRHAGPIPHWAEPVTIRAWTDADGRLPHRELSRMRRELIRASGGMVFEPDEAEEAEKESRAAS